jgi:hypothetical protein
MLLSRVHPERLAEIEKVCLVALSVDLQAVH